MRIYLAASISAGRKYREGVKAIAGVLEKNGHQILTPFVVDEKLNNARFPGLTGTERATAIFEEDMRLILESKAIIAEVSEPSTGVGMELGVLVGMWMFAGYTKPTLCLRHMDLFDKGGSMLVEGNKFASLKYYDHQLMAQNLEGHIVHFLRNVELFEGIIKKERE